MFKYFWDDIESLVEMVEYENGKKEKKLYIGWTVFILSVAFSPDDCGRQYNTKMISSPYITHQQLSDYVDTPEIGHDIERYFRDANQ